MVNLQKFNDKESLFSIRQKINTNFIPGISEKFDEIDETLDDKQNILSEWAFQDWDKTKLDKQSWTNTWDNAPNANTWLVHTTWDETIWGKKTFSDNLILSSNVWIGTTNPSEKLHISNSANARMIIQETTGSTWATSELLFQTSETIGFAKWAIIWEDTWLSWARWSLHLCVNNSASAVNAWLADAKLTVLNNGNVWIWTTNPWSKLSVVWLPTSATWLSPGDIWNNSGQLMIVT